MKLEEVLQKAGVPKHSAKILAVIVKKQKSIRAVEIERATDLRQPEVSISINWLREKGWITSTDIKPKGKGRPTQLHSLNISAKQLYKEIEEEQMNIVREQEDNLKQLKKLLT